MKSIAIGLSTMFLLVFALATMPAYATDKAPARACATASQAAHHDGAAACCQEGAACCADGCACCTGGACTCQDAACKCCKNGKCAPKKCHTGGKNDKQ